MKTKTKVYIVGFHLYKTLENAKWCIVTKSSLGSWWGCREGWEVGTAERPEPTSGDEGWVHHPHCGQGFTRVYLH